MRTWNLEDLKNELKKRPEIAGWVIARENVHRRERYFLSEEGALAVDQDRDARIQSTSLRLFVPLENKPGRQGEVSKKLFADRPLDFQVDAAVKAALQTDHQAWSLPTESPASVPEVRGADPRISEDVDGAMKTLTSRIEAAAAAPSKAAFNSAELFLSLHERELHWSNGLKNRSSQTRVYVEAAYSATKTLPSGETVSDEYLHTSWGVGLDSVDVGDLFADTAERATLMLETRKPSPGKYAVLVDSEVLSTLFHAVLGQLTGSNRYLGLPSVSPGSPLVPELQAGADAMTWSLDPTLDLGADTAALSDTGLVQCPLRVVDANRVETSLLDQQYATYLGEKPTTVRGDLVVSPGSRSHAELLKGADQVLEILQFSGLFVDGGSGTFASEIRLARLHDRTKGTSTIIKGGSLSGSFKENFRGALLSRETERRAHFSPQAPSGSGYLGPKFALLTDVSIAG
jgi:predicted Zn-dependent protease